MIRDKLKGVKHHSVLNELTSVLCKKTQNTDRSFYQPLVIFFISTLASSMRASVTSKHRGVIPVNAYVIDLGTSGLGKGYAINIMEELVLKKFVDRFTSETFPQVANASIRAFAEKRAVEMGTDDVDLEYQVLKGEDKSSGTFKFFFSEGTTPALKQFRHKLLLARCGAINFQIDEIAKVIHNVNDILVTFLELYDVGKTKEKLIKNTAENVRYSNIVGATPANLLIFGSPVLLFDGSTTESTFFDFLATGYGRRSWFGNGLVSKKAFLTKTGAEVYYDQISEKNDDLIEKWSNLFEELADYKQFYNWQASMGDEVAILLTEYQLECEKRAYELPEHQELKRAEISHRYFKVMKLAGVYAFLNKEKEVTEEVLLQAILAAEESGESFNQILNREKAHVRLAKFIISSDDKLTQADLTDQCPWYKGAAADKKNMLTLAQAYAYKHHAVIKRGFIEDVEFFSGQALNVTDLDKITLSASREVDLAYVKTEVSFDKLYKLMQQKGFNWCSHSFVDNERKQDNAQKGFNVVVFDIDGDISIETAKDVLKDYTFLLHTTKSHTDTKHRFRVILPINYTLYLDPEEYSAFMDNVLTWFPFDLKDKGAMKDIARKWLTVENCHYEYNEGKLLDVIPFIPDSKKNEEYRAEIKEYGNVTNLERWFLSHMLIGNRNNNLLKYAYCLIDKGLGLPEIEKAIKNLNQKLGSNALELNELESTVLLSTVKKHRERHS